jgi:hypothetical protein
MAASLYQYGSILKLTHKSGIEVVVGFERSWHRTLLRALRILRARVYARQKGIEKIEEAGEVPVEVAEIHPGEYVVAIEIGSNTFTVTERDFEYQSNRTNQSASRLGGT